MFDTPEWWVQNDAELAGMQAAHIRDGAACVIFWAWLDKQVQRGVKASLLSLQAQTDGQGGDVPVWGCRCSSSTALRGTSSTPKQMSHGSAKQSEEG